MLFRRVGSCTILLLDERGCNCEKRHEVGRFALCNISAHVSLSLQSDLKHVIRNELSLFRDHYHPKFHDKAIEIGGHSNAGIIRALKEQTVVPLVQKFVFLKMLLLKNQTEGFRGALIFHCIDQRFCRLFSAVSEPVKDILQTCNI